MTHDQRLVLAQTAVSATTSQVPGRTDLLAGVDLAGAVLTVEARHPVRATATWLHAHGADFALTV